MLGLGGFKEGAVLEALQQFLVEFDRLDIGVSYIQKSGWELLKPLLRNKLQTVRILCTDQLGISDPDAIRDMKALGIDVRAYGGKVVFHPKLYLLSKNDQADTWLLGSANLSRSALKTGVEAMATGADEDGNVRAWFDELYDGSVEFDEARLETLARARAARIKSSLVFEKVAPQASATEADPATAETIELIFSSLENPVVPLNADKAGNNVRNLSRIKEVLDDPTQLANKALSEFKLIGLARDGGYSPLGKSLQHQPLEIIGQGWVNWLKNARPEEIMAANPSGRLAKAVIAFDTFWSFSKEITDYFLANANSPSKHDRPLLQTIELLANAGRCLPNLSLDEIATLSSMLTANENLPFAAREAIEGYLANKGTRGWDEPDRALILNAWQQAG